MNTDTQAEKATSGNLMLALCLRLNPCPSVFIRGWENRR